MKRLGSHLAATLLFVGGAAAVQACGDDDDVSIPAPDGGADAGPDGTSPVDAGRDVSPPVTDAQPPIDTGAADTGAVDADVASDGGTLDGGACDGGTLSVTAVTPRFGATGRATAITVSGTGFVSTPRVYLVSAGGVITQVNNAAFVSSSSLTAIVPSGLAVGKYDLAVINPGECAGRLVGSFDVVATPAPTVLSVAPAQGTTQTDVPVTITGCDFPANATVATLDATGTLVAHTTGGAPTAGANDPRCNDGPLYTMSATIETKTKALGAGAYVVRVTNPTDATFGDYSSFVVSNPSGNLTGGWQAMPPLVTGRRSLALVSARLDDATRFLYAVGGETAAGAPLASVEVAQVDRFGAVGAWTKLPQELKTARSGLSIVQRGLFLYAIGGTSSTDGTRGANATNPSGTPLATIERAKLLEPSGAPKLTAATAATGGGSLASGAYYYKVAAVLDGTDAATEGETLPSEELVTSLSATGTISLTWTAPAVGAVAKYRVYRTASGDGASGQEVLLADNVNGTSYADDGSGTPGTDKPLAVGATGPWVVSGSTLAHARFNAAAVTATDPLGARFVYVAGGWGQCGAGAAAMMSCTERATLSEDGATLGAFAANLTSMGRARMGHGADVHTSGTSSFVVLAGGKGSNGPANTVESAVVLAGGELGAWANAGGFSNERDGSRLLIANGFAYALFGGGAPNYSQTADQSTAGAADAGVLTFANWNNAGANFSTKLGRHGATAESAYFYVAGGTTSDTDALTGVFRVLH